MSQATLSSQMATFVSRLSFNDLSDEHLKRFLDIEIPALKQRYGDNAVNFKNVVGRLPRLYIQYSDTPFSWLYTATPGQITEFARKMRDDAWDLRWQIGGTMEKLYEPDLASVQATSGIRVAKELPCLLGHQFASDAPTNRVRFR